MKKENVILIGKKPVSSYAFAVITQFNSGASEVRIKARGNSISRAVDTAEFVRHRLMPDARLNDIQISTEEVSGEKGPLKVSSIEITLVK
ncbi:MAG: DNA-binding protein Alba [Candidatus Altiarchaeota archaeon]|nr:DNA-binding protein Alba [Candidatus Altiarchaeota archaeon]